MAIKKIVRLMTTALLIVVTVLFSNSISLAQTGSTHLANAPEQKKWQDNIGRSATWLHDDQPQFATDHILVKQTGATVARVAVPDGSTVAATIAQWQQADNVEYAEPDHLYHALGQETSWGWTTVQAGEASTNNVTGSGVIVGVVDTGVDYVHEDLDANNWVNTAETADNGIDDDHNGYVDDYYGYDFIGSFYTAVTPDSDPQDEYGHGTHVAGIIAAENNSVGVRGIAPSAQIMPVKVLDSVGSGFDSTIADGITYAVDNGADVINLSLGSSTASNTLKTAIDYAETRGVLVIAAAGNETTFSAPSYPAAYSNVVSVGATNEDGYKAEFSNWGKVDVMAPGVDIESSIPGNLYAEYSGTSMASPHVAGVAALIIQKFGTTDTKIVRHILQTGATDFGTISGPDYVSGRGLVNALNSTNAQATSAYLFADTGYIVSDGSEDAVITVSLRNNVSQAIANETIIWSTTKGTLSASSSITNSNGQASVTLTADDTYGLATITADPANYDGTTMQIAILSDIPRAESTGVSPYIVSTDSDSEGPILLGGGETELSNNYYAPGDQITIWSHPTGYDRAVHDVTMSYAVTDPDGNTVADLSGSAPETSVGYAYWIWYLPQTTVQSVPLTIPTDAASGEYTVTVTLTDSDTAETSTNSSSFWVGELPEILVIDNDGYCYDTPVEGLDFGYVAYCDSAGQKVIMALKADGYDSLLWNVTMHGSPTAEDLALFPVVILVDATFAYSDTSSLQSYLDAGGNLLVTSEQFAYSNTYAGEPSSFLWDYFHAAYASSISQPTAVTGVTGTDFSGDSYNVDTYNIAGNGTHGAYVADELLLNSADGTAQAIFSHTQGKTADKIAGIRVDADSYRAVLLSFGIETINDSGDASQANVLSDLVSWLLRAQPKVKKVTPRTISNNIDRTITIVGNNFQTTGTTRVKLRSHELSNVTVTSSNKLTATVPAGLQPRDYSVTVIRPDGKKGTKAKAVHIRQGGPIITSITPGFVSNDRVREVSLVGNRFRPNSTVWFGDRAVMDVTHGGPTLLTVKLPKDFTPGHYSVLVKTGHGRNTKVKGGMLVRVGFTETLSNGATGTQVYALERRLKNYDYFEEDPNDTFDNSTEEALARYQHDQGIETTGMTDALTRYYLNSNE